MNHNGLVRLAHPLRRCYACLSRRSLTGPLMRLLKTQLTYTADPDWDDRIRQVVRSSDNAHIPRVPDAGRLVDGHLVMHNGIRIQPESYYGISGQTLIERNRGVHEPQEERVFAEVLRHMPPRPVMVELGAYWGFYSMWFHMATEQPSCTLVEPDVQNLRSGQANFDINGMNATFLHASIGADSGQDDDGVPRLCVDDLMARCGHDRVHLLHTDIQGAELEMLNGAADALDARRVDYIFLSTHSDALHDECASRLRRYEFFIVAEAGLAHSHSVDGLIVARRADLPGPGRIPISKNRRQALRSRLTRFVRSSR